MPRPKRCRTVVTTPGWVLFKPAGVPARALSDVTLTVDELEAIRLADCQGLYQQQAAARMGVSRQTFGRIVDAARKKVATALIEGLALRIEGGNVEMAEMRVFQCFDCGKSWEEPHGTGRPAACPMCEGGNIARADGGEESSQGAGRGRHGRGGRGGPGGGGGPGSRRGRGAGRGGQAPQGPGEARGAGQPDAAQESEEEESGE